MEIRSGHILYPAAISVNPFKQPANMHSLLEESELTLRKAFVRSFVREITVTGNEARLVYSLPVMDNKRTEEESVLSIVHDGGEAGI